MSSGLNSFLFSTPEMTRIFSSESHLRAMMRFEWALVCSLERQGIAQSSSASVVESLLDGNFVNLDSLQREAADAGNLAIPFVRQLTSAVEARSEHAARVIHLGATSQDVLDTALVLEMREALKLIDGMIARLDDSLVSRIRMHAETVLTGRTWLQPGPPVTVGFKLAGTLAALRRSRDRIRAAAERSLVLQFGGAVGTLAALGNAGKVVSKDLAAILELREPEMPWHTQRDRLAEMVSVLALLTGSLAKLARDVSLLMQAEVAEASESAGDSRGGSSTMPHKHNPVACAAIIAIHARMPGLASTMLAAMPQEHERGLGLWQAEWDTVPEAFRLASAALSYATALAEGITFDPERMRANFNAQLGLPLSEAVSSALAPSIGRSAAHELLREASRRAAEEKRPLMEILRQLPEVTAHLNPAELDRLFDPSNYLGSSRAFIARVLGDAHGNE
jgi:3-carboxy-cis,cis-muconate cycloisomerase